MVPGSSWRVGVAVAVALGVLCAGAAWAETGPIGPDDWQYRELDALAQAGLLNGRPQGPLSAWTDRLTRYEAASLTLRAVEALGKACEEQGEALREMAQAAPAPERPMPRGVTAEDLARVEKLIEEFRAELVTMGARVDDLETALAEVGKRLAKVEKEQQKHKLDGYVQFRYEDDSAPSGKEQFLVRRTRLNVRGPVSEKMSYRVEFQLDAKESGKGRGSKVQLRTAYADYKLSSGRLRVGQAKIPWGYELLESVPKLWTAERALFMDRLFPNQRDIGVQGSFRRSAAAPQLDVGIFNGSGINVNDNNSRKNVMARVDFPLPNGSLALSGYVGEDGEGAAATDQDRYGASARFEWPRGTEFMGELVTGKDRGYDVRGWYAQLGQPVSKSRPDLLFVKYDQYDEDTDASDDLFERWSLGYWWEPEPPTRISVVYEIRNPQPGFSELSKWDDNRGWVQLQVRF